MSSWLSKALGTNSLKQDFNYDPAQADAGVNFGQVANQMLSGTGSFMEAQRAQGAKAVQDAAAQSRQAQDMAMAQRGLGGGGLRSLMDATSGAQAGESISNYNLGLAGQGFQQAGQFSGMALQQAMANQQAQNQAIEYAKTSAYNQAAGNKASRGNFFGNVMSMASGPLSTLATNMFRPSDDTSGKE